MPGPVSWEEAPKAGYAAEKTKLPAGFHRACFGTAGIDRRGVRPGKQLVGDSIDQERTDVEAGLINRYRNHRTTVDRRRPVLAGSALGAFYRAII
jgi:hypothetical protein